MSDLATLRDQSVLFGPVASDATVWRTVNLDVDEDRRGAVVAVRLAAAAVLADRAGLHAAGEVVLDVDATLLHLHSENKQQAAPTFKRGFGFHPMLCFIEPLGVPVGVLRPGNATANDTAAHLAVVDQAIGVCPPRGRQATAPTQARLQQGGGWWCAPTPRAATARSCEDWPSGIWCSTSHIRVLLYADRPNWDLLHG